MNYFLINFISILIINQFNIILCNNYSFINLPESHLSNYFNKFKSIRDRCLSSNENCEYLKFLKSKNYNENSCWGYEDDCKDVNRFSKHKCPGDHMGWVSSKEGQIDTFYTQADFGYIKQQKNEMMVMCEPLFLHDSSLECSKYTRFCRGRNIMVNFTDLITRKEPFRYKMDVLKEGQIGGYCTLHKKRLEDELEHVSALQSWAPELRYFRELKERPIQSGKCDVVIEKPTIFMKIDATINMYHHFCDFFNLYSSLHVNITDPYAFDTDVNILIWETYTYNSPFAETFKVFTKNQILDLKTFRGEVVCFKNLMFPLLPRMIFGLYYNTPIIYGCENSGLFHAFSEHILHRMKIPLRKRENKKIRITFLSRQTKFRRILNEEDLVESISKNKNYHVKHVTYDRELTFKKQLEITRNSDILIGIHGAGLTHLLFLPNWATIFEIYNCEDPNCYKDLARLRGVNYMTWEDSTKVYKADVTEYSDKEVHAKFINYRFSIDEFKRLVKKAADFVSNHEEYKNFIKENLKSTRDEL